MNNDFYYFLLQMLPPKFLATISIVLFLVEQCLNSPVYTMQPAFITANIGECPLPNPYLQQHYRTFPLNFRVS